MSEINFSRRSMIAATGLGAVSLPGNSGNQKQEWSLLPAKPSGINPAYGDDANPTTPAPSAGTFDTKVLTLVRLSCDKDFSIYANYMSLLNDSGGPFPTDDSKREAIAIQWFADSIQTDATKPDYPRKKFKALKDKSNIHLHTYVGKGRDREDFEKFGSNQKTEYYFWIDSKNVRPAKKKDPTRPDGSNDLDYLVSFSEYLSDGRRARPNKSFKARLIKGHGLDGIVIAVKNFFLDENGFPIGDKVPVEELAMDIHFEAKGPGTGSKTMWIPMIFDPDTGNGMGHEP